MAKRASRSSKAEDGLNRGAWTAMEDQLLFEYVTSHGKTAWNSMPGKIGLKRCGKSCRLRWLNYLRPDIKRGNISSGEEDLILRLHGLLGNRWTLIAGRLPGRTDNEIKNYWNTHLSKKMRTSQTHTKSNKRRKSDCPATDRLLKVTPVKVTAVRISNGCNKNMYTHSGDSTDEETASGQTVNTSINSSELITNLDSYTELTNFAMAAEPENPSGEINGQYSPEDFGIEEIQKSSYNSFVIPTENFMDAGYNATEVPCSGTQYGDWMDGLQDFLLSEFHEEDFTQFS